MNALELKRLLSGLPDDELSRITCVVPGSDHSYQKVYAASKTTAVDSDGYLAEDHDLTLEDGERKVDVLVIS